MKLIGRGVLGIVFLLAAHVTPTQEGDQLAIPT
jgi:hypothetical protein